MNRYQLIKQLGYCECRISSPSSHHDCCINEGCGKVIKTSGEHHQECVEVIKELLTLNIHHTNDCPWITYGGDCDCGLDQTLAKAKRAIK